MVVQSLGDSKLLTLGSLATASIATAAVGAWWYKKHLKNQPPSNWIKVGEVSNLYIYPLKSCGALRQDSLECTFSGVRNGTMRDRMFLIMNQEGRAVTGRDYPKMLKITSSINETVLTVTADDFVDTVEVDFKELDGEHHKVRVWGAQVEGVDCGDEVAEWLSRYLSEGKEVFRMLYYFKEETKDMNKDLLKFLNFMNMSYKKTDSGFFSDAASFHLISEASINELNGRVSTAEVLPVQFRPNFVVKGEKLIPFEEDSWEWLKIGDVVFQQLGPCTRCLFTTVNPETGKKADDMEPLKSLRKYRMIRDSAKKKFFNSPAMGVYFGARSEGYVHLSDDVYIPA